jgi:acetyltransferase-like isoleucine patch superfamily enzyme
VINPGEGTTKYQISWLENLIQRLDRKLQLFRGGLAHLRGTRAGRRFGIGRGVRLIFPECLTVGDDVTIGDFSFLHCLSENGVRIGSGTSVDRNLWLHCGGTLSDHAHGYVEIGDNSYIGCNAVIGAGGGIRIGSHVLIGQSVNLHAENHRYADPDRLIVEQGVSYQGIVIEDDVWIGSKAIILDGVKIGRGAVIGAATVVNRSIPEHAIALGVPAQIVGKRSSSILFKNAGR